MVKIGLDVELLVTVSLWERPDKCSPIEGQSPGLGEAGGNHPRKGRDVVVFGKTGSVKRERKIKSKPFIALLAHKKTFVDCYEKKKSNLNRIIGSKKNWSLLKKKLTY